jgi:hypothetical protein
LPAPGDDGRAAVGEADGLAAGVVGAGELGAGELDVELDPHATNPAARAMLKRPPARRTIVRRDWGRSTSNSFITTADSPACVTPGGYVPVICKLPRSVTQEA